MSKLKDDPGVASLVEKEVAKALAAAEAQVKRALKALARDLKELAGDHAGDAKTAGNKDGALRLKSLGDDLAARVKDIDPKGIVTPGSSS